LQPSDRVVGGELQRVDEALDWKALMKQGDNGFLVVMLGLAWWGACVHVEGDDASIMEWSQAVDDVKWVVSNFSTTTTAPSNTRGKKRGTDDNPSSISKGRSSKKR
jgi:hypothetical protein